MTTIGSAASAGRLAQWQQYIAGLEPGSQIPPPILESWDRSRAAGVAPERATFHRIDEQSLAARRTHNAGLLEAAEPHLGWVHKWLAGVPHVLYVVDADGIVLRSFGTDDELLHDAGLLPGYDWSEARMGTNGAGTALASGRSAVVVGCDHYCRRWHESTCIGAPILDRAGNLVGAVDLSTRLDDGDPSRLMLVSHLAYSIGQALALRDEQETPVQRLASVVSHELRAPLGSVLLRAAHLGADDVAPEQVRNHAEGIRASIKVADRVLRDAVDAASLEAGPLALSLHELELEPLVQDTLEVARPLALQRGVRVATDVPAGLRVRCDPERILRVLANLLDNAVALTDPGEVVTVVAKAEAEQVLVEVQDDGPGIAPEQLERIFERGWSGRRSSGLGLWLAKQIVEAHGGQLEVQTVPGQGATFRFTLPEG